MTAGSRAFSLGTAALLPIAMGLSGACRPQPRIQGRSEGTVRVCCEKTVEVLQCTDTDLLRSARRHCAGTLQPVKGGETTDYGGEGVFHVEGDAYYRDYDVSEIPLTNPDRQVRCMTFACEGTVRSSP